MAYIKDEEINVFKDSEEDDELPSGAERIEDVVLEDTLYVRTSYNLLKDLNGNLLDLVKKGSSVEIIGFNKLLSDGSVDL